jgi:hypothetical protein
VIGLDDAGDFVPLLRLDTASAAGNVMSLSVYHHGQWQPTFERGTPGELAERLAGPLQHLWTIAVAAADFDLDCIRSVSCDFRRTPLAEVLGQRRREPRDRHVLRLEHVPVARFRPGRRAGRRPRAVHQCACTSGLTRAS